MEKYVTNIKDFVILVLENGAEIKNKAESSDALSCFQMGMINLLGINTPTDYKKASQFFSNQSLADNQDATSLLGFIAECEGNYSKAFQNYAQAGNGENYLDKVIAGRNHIQDYLKRLDLPTTLNKVISSIFYDYVKGDASKTETSIKVAVLCDDSFSCFEAANNLYEAKDYISAIQWLYKGKMESDNSLYTSIKKTLDNSKDVLRHTKDIQVIEIESNSLISNQNTFPLESDLKGLCDNATALSIKDWEESNKKFIDSIIQAVKEKEHEEWLIEQAEEEKKAKKKKLIIKHSIICIVLFVFGILFNKEMGAASKFISGILCIIFGYTFYLLIWFIKKQKNGEIDR